MESTSKSELKRQANRQQVLGARLSKLNKDQLESLPLSNRLKASLIEYQRFRSNGARKRQLQYIGKLMRSEDTSAIEQALKSSTHKQVENLNRFHELEHWRQKLLLVNDAVSDYLSNFPKTPKAELQELVDKAKTPNGKKYRRLLFKFLSENEAKHSDS